MRPVRNLFDELVERRLWPIALALVAALVAVPLLLSKPAASTDADTAPADAPPAAAAAAARTPGETPPGGEPVVSVAQAEQPNAPLRGRAKNPFRQQHPATDDAGPSAASAGTSTGGAGTGGSSGGGTSGGQAPSSPRQTYVYASIDVRFGRAGHHLRTIEDVPRLTPLPNANHPIVVFLGMRRDHETAVFLVSTDVHVQGLGQCVPSQKTCEAIELREGEVALLDFTESDGTVEQYELDLEAVTVHTTTSQAVAQQAYARASRRGRLLLSGSVHSSLDGVAPRRRLPFHYVASRGVLHIAPWASKRARAHRAHGSVSGARLADLPPAGR
ncbi:MAG TPA: hypothetical protein VFS37_13850 [Conexibacter sp.]|nr:hypothetical protein [Conexibacter sp.]